MVRFEPADSNDEPMGESRYHIFTKTGDARAEVDALHAQLDPGGTGASGFHKQIYVTRADQTVVFVAGAGSPLAEALRRRAGWAEPEPGAG